MAAHDGTPVAVLGLGAMGSALATALIDAGYPTTVWNRAPGRDADLVARGAHRRANHSRRGERGKGRDHVPVRPRIRAREA